METLLRTSQLLIGKPLLIPVEIRDEVVSASEGMFLWAYLQLLLLCLEDSDYWIRQSFGGIAIAS